MLVLSLREDVEDADQLLKFGRILGLLVQKLGREVVLVVELGNLIFLVDQGCRVLIPVLTRELFEELELRLTTSWLR